MTYRVIFPSPWRGIPAFAPERTFASSDAACSYALHWSATYLPDTEMFEISGPDGFQSRWVKDGAQWNECQASGA